MREHEASIPTLLQLPVLRAFDAVERLRRLSEMSLKYLEASSSKLIDLNSTTLPSIKKFTQEIVDDFQMVSSPPISLTTEINDQSFDCDPYWLTFCLQNLLQNAIKYGKAPLHVRLLESDHKIGIAVQDSGELSDKQLHSLYLEKQSSLSGLGLGLSLVRKVTTEMSFELQISQKPTCFTIWMGKKT